ISVSYVDRHVTLIFAGWLGRRSGIGCSSHDSASWVTGCGPLLEHGPGLDTLAALSPRGPRAHKGTPLLRISGKRGRARSWHGSLYRQRPVRRASTEHVALE